MLGLNQPIPELFENIDWGTGKVLKQTLAKVKNYKLLQTLSDVDKFEDIPKKISVIIPTLNEEKNIACLLNQLKNGFNVEPVIVDGGSKDNTLSIVRQMKCKVVVSPSGRAKQMNKGAAIASGDILFFAHADSILPDNWDICIRETIEKNNPCLVF